MKIGFLKKALIISTAIILLLGIMPGSFRLLNLYKLNASEDTEFWDPKTDSNFDMSLVKRLSEINKTMSFTEFYKNIETITDNEINNYKIVIEDALDLYTLSNQSHTDVYKHKYTKAHYILGNNINYDDASSKSLFFVPIGSQENKFTGSFDGNGFEISNLFYVSISNKTEYETLYPGMVYMSMFGYVGETGIIQNFGIINSNMIIVSNYDILENASHVVGENSGYIKNVYVNDTREVSGMACEGGYRFGGLVVDNKGTIEDCYFSATRISSIEVTMKLAVNACVLTNSGIITNVYYDTTKLTEVFVNENPKIVGLTQAQLNDPNVNKFADYYYNTSFKNVIINNNYPILRGFKEEYFEGKYRYLINKEIEFLYMIEMINNYAFFRNKEFVLSNCLDMSVLSDNCFKGLNVSFEGKFTSLEKNKNDKCDHHIYTNSDDSLYHTIHNLKLYNGNLIDNKYVYGIFGYTTGIFENFNISNAQIFLNDCEKIDATYDVGILIGYSRQATINNVRVDGIIDFENSLLIRNESYLKTISNLSVGGLVGRGNAIIDNCSTNGQIIGAKIVGQQNFNKSSIGGIIGVSEKARITNSVNNIKIESFQISNSMNFVQYYGGIVGRGELLEFKKNYNSGILRIVVQGENSNNVGLYVGGIIGLLENCSTKIEKITNDGNIEFIQNSAIKARIAGFGIVESANKTYYNSINARFKFIQTTNVTTTAQLSSSLIKYSYGIIARDSECDINGINIFEPTAFDSSFDLSVIHEFAANFLIENIDNNVESCSIKNSLNKTNNNFITSQSLMMNYLKISNNVIGKNVEMESLFNEGMLDIYLTKPATSDYNLGTSNGVNLYKEFKAFQLFEEISVGYNAKNLVNSGDLKIKTGTEIDNTANNKIRFNFLIGGLGYKNGNTNIFAENNIDYKSIKVDADFMGSLNNCINYGNIYVDLNVYGQSRIGGIVNINSSLISNAYNFGNIFNRNAVQTKEGGGNTFTEGQFEVETGGICYLMNNEYAQLKDCINSGTIVSISTTDPAWVNSSGIASRNDKTEDGTGVTANTNKSKYGKIQFSANYGDIIAYNNFSDTENSSEYRNKASGILAIGVLSVVNTVNYGNIFGKSTASGIYANVDLSKFNISAKEIYVANSMNYGIVRKLNANNTGIYHESVNNEIESYELMLTKLKAYANNSSNYTATTSWGIGALIGLVNFNNSTTNANNIEFSYLINFDASSDITGRAASTPSFSSAQITKITQFMATTKVDTSPTPFTGIKQYSMSTSENGVFNSLFPLRNPPKNSEVETDKYISDYIQFVPYSKVNLPLIKKIGFDVYESQGDLVGIYALSSSTGILHGVFLPDSIKLDELNISKDSSSPNYNEFVTNKLFELKQLKLSISTEVFDLELINTIDESIKLNNPQIDTVNSTLTYHIADNQKGSISPLCSTGNCKNEIITIPGPAESTGVNYAKVNEYITVGELVSNLLKNNPNMSKILIYNDKNGENNYTQYTKKDINNSTILGTRIYDSKTSSFVNVGYYKLNNTTYNYLGNAIYGGNYNVTFKSATFGSYAKSSVMDNLNNSTFDYYNYSGFMSGYNTDQVSNVGVNQGLYTYANNRYAYAGPITDYDQTYVKYEIYEPNGTTTIEVPNTYSQFRINSIDNFTLAFNAIFKSDYSIGYDYSYGKYASVPRYTSEEETTDFQDHLGKFSVIAEDRTVAREFTIIIVRTSERKAEIQDLMINGTTPEFDSISENNIILSQNTPMLYKNGSLFLTLQLLNFKNQYNILSSIAVSKYNSETRLFDTLTPRNQLIINGKTTYFDQYILEDGIVNNPNVENGLGSLGYGTVNIDLKMNEFTTGGIYKISIYISETQTIEIQFNKELSPGGIVTSINYNNVIYNLSENSLTTYVPFGKFYYDGCSDNSMNFSNLYSIKNVNFNEINTNMPSYVNYLEISMYSTLESISFSVIKDIKIYKYTITYNIIAEDGTKSTFVHLIQEIDYKETNKINAVYRDGSKLTLNENSSNQLETSFYREEEPNFRVEYNFDNFYIPYSSVLSVENSDLTIDINILENIGFDLYFSNLSEVKDYYYNLKYVNQVNILNINLMWNIDFQTIKITKNPNINSYLKNIKFISDTIYAGLNTIMDNELISVNKYQELLNNPTMRKITVLPSGIYYNNYESINKKFYIIGQVQKTNLNYYSPSFELPEGATIYRRDTNGNEYGDGTATSNDLKTEYVFTNDIEFLFTTYRVYAENKNYYTDFNIAIQDLTYNVKFDIDINFQQGLTSTNISQIFISLVNYQTNINGEPIKDDKFVESKSSFYCNYDGSSNSFINTNLPSSKAGFYRLFINLPKEYMFTYAIYDGANKITISAEDLVNNGFVINSSIVSKKYRIEINILKNTNQYPWGIGDIIGL